MADYRPRLERLTAILTQLRSSRMVTARKLAEKHNVSIRTIYRDMSTLEKSGIPIITEEGKGYCLMDGYNVPPVMFTESEAFALITAEQLIANNKDISLIREFSKAVEKIKTVLKQPLREKAETLKERIVIRQKQNSENSSNYLSVLQLHLINNQCVSIDYSDEHSNLTTRILEPFVLYNEGDNWLLFAFCRLRKDFRVFRLDRIKRLYQLDEKYSPQQMTFQQFLEKYYTTSDI